MRLPNADRAVVPPAKVRDYLLSHSHPVGRFKARFFRALGFSIENWELLSDALHQSAATSDFEELESPFGRKFKGTTTIIGPEGERAVIATVWILRERESEPTLVTAYPSE